MATWQGARDAKTLPPACPQKFNADQRVSLSQARIACSSTSIVRRIVQGKIFPLLSGFTVVAIPMAQAAITTATDERA